MPTKATETDRARRARRARPAAVLALLSLLAALLPAAAAQAEAPPISARGSAEQAYAVGLQARHLVLLVNRHGRTVAARKADSLGGVVFRKLVPGPGYRIRQGGRRSGPVTVFGDRSAPPSTKIYNQRLPASGYGYLTTRDGTKLAIDVRLPGGSGPYPTLVEYSGYGYADPAGAQSGISQLATVFGFAVVDVNMRGTGCSGGSFDYFERLQNLDGYDVIETVARQPWVLHHRVGMLGISYGAISQLFVAATDPPHLAAIAPMSTIDDTATTLYPGGILNTGFAVGWAQDRQNDAEPASAHGGQAWAYQRILDGDQTCKRNQILHGEAPNIQDLIAANSHYVAAFDNPLSPDTFVHRIHVPTYLACQFSDEQTGPHCPELAEHFTGTRHKWFTFTNGYHIDSLDPTTFDRLYDFYELYVARRAPQLSPLTRAEAPLLYSQAMNLSGITLPPDPIQQISSYSAALAAFQRLKRVRILFDNGAGGSSPGDPYPAFERSFSRFPIPGTRARSWYLNAGGSLADGRPRRPGADRFSFDRHALPATDFTGSDGPDGLWGALPSLQWLQNPPGTAASYLTAPLRSNTVVIGAGAVQLWVKASVPSVDLQVTISEVRPDGKETFVQNGWLRANERKLDRARSTLLQPVPSLRAADVSPLPRQRFTELTVPLYYEGHAYRRGSQIRLVVSAPGGTQPIWAFARARPRGRATVWIAHGRRWGSRLVLPVIGGVPVPTGLPPCPGLRGEPCRAYQPYPNQPAHY